ncbi:MAG: prepilin-type N-terminal cleavage/methylation domain-containing protein [Gallionellaceae bacterium]
MKHKFSGFTLIEIAIVLVIITLLLGGVMKGQELINNAKVTNLVRDFDSVKQSIYGYQASYKVLPGDDVNANVHVAGTVASTPVASIGNGTVDGSWDSITATDETVVFWEHVRLAGLLSGQQNITVSSILDPYFSVNVAGGRIGVQGNLGTATSPKPIAGIPGTYVICSANIPGKLAKRLDIMQDDGDTALGSMRVTSSAAGTAAIANGQAVAAKPLADDSLYTVCLGV